MKSLGPGFSGMFGSQESVWISETPEIEGSRYQYQLKPIHQESKFGE